ncbi:hypothetical protein JOE62_002961 [Glutamicibacter nicotianae]|nr:hypothetical protein [Glutamicibacter nicotianae]
MRVCEMNGSYFACEVDKNFQIDLTTVNLYENI